MKSRCHSNPFNAFTAVWDFMMDHALNSIASSTFSQLPHPMIACCRMFKSTSHTHLTVLNCLVSSRNPIYLLCSIFALVGRLLPSIIITLNDLSCFKFNLSAKPSLTCKSESYNLSLYCRHHLLQIFKLSWFILGYGYSFTIHSSQWIYILINNCFFFLLKEKMGIKCAGKKLAFKLE